MANRALLHKNKLPDFEKWLKNQGYIVLETSKNPFEVLRAKKDKNIVIVYCRAASKEHLTVMDKDYKLVKKFVKDSFEQKR